MQQATGEQATSELATGESFRNSSGICRNPLDTNPFSSVVQSFRTPIFPIPIPIPILIPIQQATSEQAIGEQATGEQATGATGNR